jgi:hypothetical protein
MNNGFQAHGAPLLEAAISEVNPDNDATYDSNGPLLTVPHQVAFSLSAATPPSNSTVLAVQTLLLGRAGAGAGASAGLSAGGIESVQPVTLGPVYAVHAFIHLTNPLTQMPWLPADVDTIQGVLKDTDSLPGDFRITSAWWDVVYSQGIAVPPPSPTPTARPSPGPTATPTPQATPTARPSPQPTATPTPRPAPQQPKGHSTPKQGR